MPARAPEKILEDLVKGQGKEAILRRKLTANRERNWFLALYLNSCGKLATNTSLTDLDEIIVNAFHQHGFTDEELKLHGRLYQQIPEQTRHDLFPGKFATFDPQTKYTINEQPAVFTDFRAGAPIWVDYDVRDRRFVARSILGRPRR